METRESKSSAIFSNVEQSARRTFLFVVNRLSSVHKGLAEVGNHRSTNDRMQLMDEESDVVVNALSSERNFNTVRLLSRLEHSIVSNRVEIYISFHFFSLMNFLFTPSHVCLSSEHRIFFRKTLTILTMIVSVINQTRHDRAVF